MGAVYNFLKYNNFSLSGISAAEYVVEMEVGAEKMAGTELVGLYVFMDIAPFYVVHASWVDDTGFSCGIAHYITVDSEWIDLEGLDDECGFLCHGFT